MPTDLETYWLEQLDAYSESEDKAILKTLTKVGSEHPELLLLGDHSGDNIFHICAMNREPYYLNEFINILAAHYREMDKDSAVVLEKLRQDLSHFNDEGKAPIHEAARCNYRTGIHMLSRHTDSSTPDDNNRTVGDTLLFYGYQDWGTPAPALDAAIPPPGGE